MNLTMESAFVISELAIYLSTSYKTSKVFDEVDSCRFVVCQYVICDMRYFAFLSIIPHFAQFPNMVLD